MKTKAKIKARLEHANGEAFNLNDWFKIVLQNQDIPRWQIDCGQQWKAELADWVKHSLKHAIQNLDVVITEDK